MKHPFFEFTKRYFDKMGIPSHVINLQNPIPDDVDMRLRKTIVQKNSSVQTTFPEIPDSFVQDHLLFFTEDLYSCHYILLPIPEQELPVAMILGPYLTESPGIQRTQEIAQKHNIPQGLWPFLNQYYSSITYIDNVSYIESYIETLAEQLYGFGNFTIRSVRQANVESVDFYQSADSTSNESTMQQLEHRYDLEEKMMDSIARGDYEKAIHYSTDKAFSGVDERASTTLRSKKNNLFAFNTLCRKAAERGKVHPVFLDEMSRKMAIKIENMSSPKEDKDVHREILKKYCLMVQQQSTSGYTPVMQKILNYISQNLAEPELTLQDTALKLGFNKTYLASLFKKETGSTFTTFVNKKRMDHAIFLLNTSDYPVHSIALMCGIQDMTYFTRIFKKEKGMTPTRYRNLVREK